MLSAVENTQETWGISGPKFALLYMMAAAAIGVVVAFLTLRVKGRAKGGATLLQGLPPEQIALLTSDDAAIASALASLSASGALASAHQAQATARSGLPLPRAILNAHSAGRARTYADFKNDPEVRAALDAARADLQARGLLVTADCAPLLLWRFVPFLALALLGLARIFAGLVNGKPVAFITMETTLTALVTGALLRRQRRGEVATNAARAALTDLRCQHRDLSPDVLANPQSDRATARSAAPMSAALFGTAALVHGDPQLASSLAIPTVKFAGIPTTYSSVSTGGSSCSSSSCGGGCGGGCGG